MTTVLLAPEPGSWAVDAIPVTRARVQARTRELAIAAGRTPLQITQADYERARTELTGETDMGRQEAVLEGQAGPAQPEAAEVRP